MIATLHELEAEFLRISPEGMTIVDSLDKAQGLMFLCPRCFETNDGKVGTHTVVCWFADRGVPDDKNPKPGRWMPSGTGINDLTFVGPAAASVLLTTGCQWHGFIRDGKATT